MDERYSPFIEGEDYKQSPPWQRDQIKSGPSVAKETGSGLFPGKETKFGPSMMEETTLGFPIVKDLFY